MVTKSAMKSLAETVSEFVAKTRLDDIPTDVVNQGKRILLDTLGAIIRATSDKYSAGAILASYARERSSTPDSTVIGQGFRTDVVDAALVNGTMGYYCDVESIHPPTISHPAAVVVPTALAVGESRKLSGEDVLRAVILGCEIETRVSDALGPAAMYERGFHPSSVAGAFGAAAAAGNLLGLSAKQQNMAFGLAGCQACGLLAWKADHTEHSRPFQMGLAARNGVTSALLAGKGFGGPPDIFEGAYGIFGAFTDHPRPSHLVEGIGKKYNVLDLQFKMYACCGFILPGVDAMLELMSKNKLTSNDIAKIDYHFAKEGASVIDNNELKSHNTQYVLSVLAVTGDIDIDDLLGSRRTEPAIDSLSKRVKVVYDNFPEFPTKHSCVLDVTTKSGKLLSKRVDQPRGCRDNPASNADLEAKFRRIVRSELGPAQIDNCIDAINNIESVRDINELTKLIA